jgi:hypothetical protein
LELVLFSPAQCFGYLAFVAGVAAFLQKSDRRLKLLGAVQGLVYAGHFVLLGNLPASASSLISSVRSVLALKRRSPLVPALIVVINVAAGAVLVKNGAGWLTIVASCAATVAIFTMRGVRLRMVLLGCTSLWLANNILSGSIGGVLLELTIAAVNGSTIIRMLRSRPQNGARAGGPSVRSGIPTLQNCWNSGVARTRT